MRKIIFIEPNPPDFHLFTGVPIPRLGTVILGTKLRQNGYEVKSYVESITELDLKDVLSADAVGISTITSTSSRSYEIAKLIRKAGIPVFMGGPHVTYMPEEALEYADYVLRGEQDDNIVDFIRAMETGKGLDKITGLSYRRPDGTIKHNSSPPFCKDMDSIPAPDFTLIAGLEKSGARTMPLAPIMTSRGCPYDCSFCSVTIDTSRRHFINISSCEEDFTRPDLYA